MGGAGLGSTFSATCMRSSLAEPPASASRSWALTARERCMQSVGPSGPDSEAGMVVVRDSPRGDFGVEQMKALRAVNKLCSSYKTNGESTELNRNGVQG